MHMIVEIFHTFIQTPLYNGLVFLIDTMPGHSVGLAIIALTVIVRVILYPVARQAAMTQAAMRKIAPEVEALKEKFKDKREEQARAMFALYKENGIRPFSSFVLVLLQLPILIGLYFVFFRGGLPVVNMDILYSFVMAPENINMHFLGVDMGGRSIVLAVLAGLAQLTYARLSMGPRKPHVPSERSFSNDLARSMDLQMRYVLPIMLGVFAYVASAAVALYFTVGNLFMIGQEYLAVKRFRDMKGQ